MIIENSEALKNWLTSYLTNLCDADPAALAKYVIALVKKDKNESELRAFCLDQLEIFLSTQTKDFVNLLFEMLKNKSYLVNAPINPTEKTVSSPQNDNSSTTKVPPIPATGDTAESLAIKSEKLDRRLTNSENMSKAKKSFSSSSRTKSRSKSPVQKASTQRSRSRENDDKHKRYNLSEEEKFRREFLSKKADTRKREFRDKRGNMSSDHEQSRNSRFERERDQRNCDNPVDRNLSVNNSVRGRSSSSEKYHSSSSSSRSPSRGRSKERRNRSGSKNVKSDHGDKDYRINQPVIGPLAGKGPVSHIIPNSNHYGSKGPKRCQDYDEKGYCMRGDLCVFDHGNDPLVVDDVSVLNFRVPVSSNKGGVSSSGIIQGPRTGKKSPLLPPLPSSPPPVPPPPPPLPSCYDPEPYNPEAPGMNLAPREHMNYWGGPNVPVHHPPPPLHPSWPPPTGVPGVVFNINEPPPNYHHSKHQRTRELIGVPTLDVTPSINPPKGNSKENEPMDTDIPKRNFHVRNQGSVNLVSHNSNNTNENKRRSFDYNRLGPRKVLKRNNDRCTLEIRKIPKHMNTIATLNGHFSKFGRIVNLQVGYDGDEESALVQFMSHVEATSAYRSTDAVFNNRFIKVFWHNKDNQNNSINNSSGNPTSFPVKSEPVAVETSGQETTPDNNVTSVVQKAPERAVVFSSKGNLSRTIYNPAALKKNNLASVTPPPRPKILRKDTLQKRIELIKKKQEFLYSQVESQKIILDKLSKTKNEKEKEFLKQAIKEIGLKISSLQAELKKDSEDLQKFCKSTNNKFILSKTEAARELLDAEMDLYSKQRTGDDTAELVSKVTALRQKAKALGLINSPRGRTARRVRRGTIRSFSRTLNPTSLMSRSIDHRTRKIMVSNFVDKEGLLNHFAQFGDLESVEQIDSGCLVIFKTRKEAETALSMGYKYGDSVLSLAWFEDSKTPTSLVPQLDSTVLPKDMLPQILEADDDEEEEEDSEARLWRR